MKSTTHKDVPRKALCFLLALLLLPATSWTVTAKNAPDNALSTYVTQERLSKEVTPNTIPFKTAKRALPMSGDEVPTLYGSLIYSTGWESMATEDIPYGVYSFPVQDNTSVTKVATTSLSPITGTLVEDEYVTITRTLNSYGGIESITLNTFNTATWEETSEVSLLANWEYLPLIITYDETDQCIYALGYSEDWTKHTLATLDISSGEMTTVATLGTVGEMSNIFTMSATDQGGLVAICQDGNLYKIDKTTGSMTVIGSTGLMPSALQSTVYDYDTKTLYWAASITSGASKLCTVDVTSGEATVVSSFANYEEFVGLFLLNDATNKNTPDEVKIAFQFDSHGALQGTLTLTAPEKTVGGSTITDNLTIHIGVDNSEVKQVSLAAGATHSEVLTLSEGTHTLSVYAANAEGDGRKSYINLYAGIDTPKPVENVTLNIDQEGVATVTWDAVSEGAHGGYMPAEELRYRITRHDGSAAAQELTTTTFSEQLTQAIANYCYTVTPYVAHREGTPTTSNAIRYGEYYEPPYFCDFEDYNNIPSWYTFIDANNDYSMWACQNNWDDNGYVLMYSCSWSNSADDYAITPAISFDKEKLYKLSFKHSINNEWSTSVNKVKVLAGRSPVVDSLNIVIADYTDISNDEAINEAVFTLPDGGKYYLAFYIYSNSGQGTFWIDDLKIESVGSALIPEKVQYTLTADNNEPEKVIFTLTVPALSAAGTQLTDIAAIDIYRHDESEPCHTISNPTAGTTYNWTDETPVLGFTHYNVIATNQHGESLDSEQSIFVGGYTAPYTESFESRENFDLFTILNLNDDDKTWHIKNGVARYEYSVSNDANDWLISPNIKMKADRVYKIQVTAKSTQWNNENLSISIGQNTNPDNHEILIDLKNWSVADFETHSTYFIPSENNVYHVGFHAYSKKSSNSIEIDELSVIDAFSVDAPATVSDLSIVADEQGLLSCNISFNAPTTTAGGATLSAITKIDIFRNDGTEPIHTFDAPQVGEALSYTDEGATQGTNTYRIVAANEEGYGADIIHSLHIGYDTPDKVSNFVVRGNSNNTGGVLSWEAPAQGINGGVINTASLTYTIYREENYTFNEIASGITELSYTDNYNYNGEQAIFRYAIKAVTPEGTSEEVQASVTYGTLYTTPYNESFPNYNYTTNPWTSTQLTGYNCSWHITDYDYTTNTYPQDDDKGMLRFYKWNNDNEVAQGEVISPKVTLQGTINPHLTLYVRNFANANEKNYTKLYISPNDGEKILLDSISIAGESNGWVKYSYSLKEHLNCDYLSVTIFAELNDDKSSIMIDNITIDDVLDHNLTVTSFSGNDLVEITGASYTVEVKNKGSNIAESFDVTLYCNNAEVSTIHDSNLATDSVRSYQFDIEAPSIPEAGEERKYYATVHYDLDEKESDNTSDTITAVVFTPPYPAIHNLEGKAVNNTAELTWGEPELIYFTPVSDSFEDYELFAIDNIGEWTLVDVDQQRTISPRYGVTFTHCFEPKAWQVIDPQRINLYGTDVAPHTGSKCLFSMQSDGSLLDGTTTDVCNDDWLISEEVVGGTELRFWAMQPTSNYGGNEKFEVLYSTTDQATSSFILIEEVELSNMATWNEYVYTLPADAKYFAIRHTLSYFGLWLDDVTYYPTRSYLNLTVNNYNIYRDGVKIGESSTTSYTDVVDNPGTYTYAVSSTFDVGESVLSNEVSVNVTTSLQATDNDGVKVFSNNGYIIVECDDTTHITVYCTDGRVLHNTTASGNTAIPAHNGIYVVKVDDKVVKLSVR